MEQHTTLPKNGSSEHAPDIGDDIMLSKVQIFFENFRRRKTVDECEETFRELGLRYHLTNAIARSPVNFDAEKLENMRKYFETDSVEKYNNIFAPIYKVEKLAHEVAQLVSDKNYMAALPKMEDARNIMSAMFKLLHELGNQVQELQCLNMIICGEHWFICIRRGVEWDKFCTWISSFPETQRSINAGRTLDRIAVHHLSTMNTGEGFLEFDETRNIID
ncbi:hypothetical protein BS50DRAFT_583780 [Corynespora cassiicola Philippines]|uniref:Uncharacterized protein n=1 Tax=Corynespora cassiicola Philippines TaxID=1448308 RepID=A0A2T2P4G5_CORCC|nr:hypothetical protein BS50DRAFT_583780 [Corynespora cassiicola Philippines]